MKMKTGREFLEKERNVTEQIVLDRGRRSKHDGVNEIVSEKNERGGGEEREIDR